MNNNWQPFGRNILFKPYEKEKVIGQSGNKLLYGKVIAIGDEVKKIKVNDVIGYTKWALGKIIMEKTGTEHYFCLENDDYLLGVLKDGQLS